MKKTFSALITILFLTAHSQELSAGSLNSSQEQVGQDTELLLPKSAVTHKTIVREFQEGDRIPTSSHYEEESAEYGQFFSGNLALVGVKQMSDKWLVTYSGQLTPITN
jgi:hypothetical protein